MALSLLGTGKSENAHLLHLHSYILEKTQLLVLLQLSCFIIILDMLSTCKHSPQVNNVKPHKINTMPCISFTTIRSISALFASKYANVYTVIVKFILATSTLLSYIHNKRTLRNIRGRHFSINRYFGAHNIPV